MRKVEVSFGSKIGMIAAAAGSAVGLGNIWRFPSQTAGGGGAMFILLYLLCVLIVGIPLMISEFAVGRTALSNAGEAYKKLAPKTGWVWLGRFAVLGSFLLLGFYLVVCGWTLDYCWQSISGSLARVDDYTANFAALQNSVPRQFLTTFIFCFLTAVFILGGVTKGIEASAKVMMPFLFLLLIVLAIRSITLPGSLEGLVYLFKPKFEGVPKTVFLDAVGQCFFSLSLGMGCMITYGSYCKRDNNLTNTAISVSLLGALVGILAGIVIFPSAFSLAAPGENVTEALIKGGPGLLFITIPKLFNNMPLSMLWAAMFFIILALAALTSTISLMEVSTVYLHEQLGISRTVSTLIILGGMLILSGLCCLSPHIFNLSDFITAKVMLPLSGILTSLFVGWRMDRNLLLAELTNDNTLHRSKGFLKIFSFLLRWIIPTILLVVFIYGLFF